MDDQIVRVSSYVDRLSDQKGTIDGLGEWRVHEAGQTDDQHRTE
jgi:hypothetical protein